MATLYFNNSIDDDWNNLDNWWLNNTFTIPAINLPSTTDSIIISSGISVTVTNLATFNNSSYNDGTVNGDCVFNDISYNNGIITGNAIFNDSSYNNGTVNGDDVTFNDLSYNKKNINGSVVTSNRTFGIGESNILGLSYKTNTLLLLHFDGENNSTNFINSGYRPGLITRSGNVSISTNESMFGGSSAFFSADSYLEIMNRSVGFGTEDFTVEGWFYFTDNTTRKVLMGGYDNTTCYWGWWLETSDNGTLIFLLSRYPQTWEGGFYAFDAYSLISINQWNHIAAVRSNNVGYFFINGQNLPLHTQQVYGPPNTDVPPATTIGLWSLLENGYSRNLTSSPGYVDEVCITKIAKYTSNFTPPTAPFE